MSSAEPLSRDLPTVCHSATFQSGLCLCACIPAPRATSCLHRPTSPGHIVYFCVTIKTCALYPCSVPWRPVGVLRSFSLSHF
ncbi:hypothetical protein L596_011560 [Steinernema carpocapsae]|uniref:Uncharacterized protein n=1 Tax=Steinernema carpocapsae TaxID=34508 RepID=A0A4U5NV79_STECR|nr:hypothetical protein L596_011560 [Steinernema carpocapsae]